MLIRITGCTREKAQGALHQAQGSVKLSVMLLKGCKLNEAADLLDRAGGRLRTALALIGRRRSDAA